MEEEGNQDWGGKIKVVEEEGLIKIEEGKS